MRLIDADAFLKDILTAGIGKTIVEYSESDIGYMIRKRPTIAAVLPMHGKWIDAYGNYQTAECSKCGRQLEADIDGESNKMLFDGFKQFFNYCPNCGARMDGVENEV